MLPITSSITYVQIRQVAGVQSAIVGISGKFSVHIVRQSSVNGLVHIVLFSDFLNDTLRFSSCNFFVDSSFIFIGCQVVCVSTACSMLRYSGSIV